MSVRNPHPTVEYQSHNHCECDFCQSRRNVNAKKLSVSQRALMVQHAQHRNGCCCSCHDAINACTFAKGRHPTTFDPSYPVPVNQTALNAARGRNGVPGGNQYTIADSRGPRGAPNFNPIKTKDEEGQDSMKELDRLERLLILEHKARVAASLEADKLGSLRMKEEDRPQPLPAGYTSPFGSNGEMPHANGSTLGRSNYKGDSAYPGALGDGADLPTVREAFVLAHECPVTPPPQCRASHRLQDTMNDVRFVTMDPINTDNRDTLQRLVYSDGVASTLDHLPAASHGNGKEKTSTDGEKYEFGNTLAQNRTSLRHPVGTGVVWTPLVDKSRTGLETESSAPPASLRPGALAAIRENQRRKVTIAA